MNELISSIGNSFYSRLIFLKEKRKSQINLFQSLKSEYWDLGE